MFVQNLKNPALFSFLIKKPAGREPCGLVAGLWLLGQSVHCAIGRVPDPSGENNLSCQPRPINGESGLWVWMAVRLQTFCASLGVVGKVASIKLAENTLTLTLQVVAPTILSKTQTR